MRKSQRTHFPDTPKTTVPLAISLTVVMQSADETTILAANLGGDSEPVASMGNAIAGALSLETVNREWFEVILKINGPGVIELATSLVWARGRQMGKRDLAGIVGPESD